METRALSEAERTRWAKQVLKERSDWRMRPRNWSTPEDRVTLGSPTTADVRNLGEGLTSPSDHDEPSRGSPKDECGRRKIRAIHYPTRDREPSVKVARRTAHARCFLDEVENAFKAGANDASEGARRLRQSIEQLAELKETEVISTRARKAESRSFRAPTWLRVATYNARSVYGREEAINHFIMEHQIALLAIQEPMLVANNMPRGLIRSNLWKVDPHEGRRGLMWIIHPAWKDRVAEDNTLGGGCCNILWVKVTLDMEEWYLANVYLPHRKRKTNENTEDDGKEEKCKTGEI